MKEFEYFEFIPDLISMFMVVIMIILARFFLSPLSDGKTQYKGASMKDHFRSLKNNKYNENSEINEELIIKK